MIKERRLLHASRGQDALAAELEIAAGPASPPACHGHQVVLPKSSAARTLGPGRGRAMQDAGQRCGSSTGRPRGVSSERGRDQHQGVLVEEPLRQGSTGVRRDRLTFRWVLTVFSIRCVTFFSYFLLRAYLLLRFYSE